MPLRFVCADNSLCLITFGLGNHLSVSVGMYGISPPLTRFPASIKNASACTQPMSQTGLQVETNERKHLCTRQADRQKEQPLECSLLLPSPSRFFFFYYFFIIFIVVCSFFLSVFSSVLALKISSLSPLPPFFLTRSFFFLFEKISPSVFCCFSLPLFLEKKNFKRVERGTVCVFLLPIPTPFFFCFLFPTFLKIPFLLSLLPPASSTVKCGEFGVHLKNSCLNNKWTACERKIRNMSEESNAREKQKTKIKASWITFPKPGSTADEV